VPEAEPEELLPIACGRALPGRPPNALLDPGFGSGRAAPLLLPRVVSSVIDSAEGRVAGPTEGIIDVPPVGVPPPSPGVPLP
jgi:hypothetical protein